MSTVCVVGAQWGDEGKATIVDLLAENADWVARFQGGPNAGHTVMVGSEVFKLHLVPAGIVREDIRCLIGQGVVVDPEILFGEIDMLASRGISCEGRLLVSDRAHLILPYHQVLDGLKETHARQKHGTTKKGIGPCYADKVSYRGIRVADLMVPDWFETRLEQQVEAHNRLITDIYGAEPLSFDRILKKWVGHRERLSPMVVDGTEVIHDALEAGEVFLFEGAQGFLLDVDAGSYPFVTGSNSSVLGLPAGAGIAPRRIDKVIGISKAYCTRVGEGPFPTEVHGEIGDFIRERGNEFGTTTGRPRRCGWIDTVALKYAHRVSGFDEIAITKLDILSGIETLKVATAYEVGGSRTTGFPASFPALGDAVPIYEEFPGFSGDITGAREFGDLPENARAFVLALEGILGAPIRLISVGPEREQVVRR